VVAKDIKVKPNGLEFTLTLNSKKSLLKVNLLGKHNVLNLLGAIAAAKVEGLSLKEIKKGLGKISPLDHTLKPYLGVKKTSVYDDSYTENPKGIRAAFEFVKTFRSRKILVMPCLIELGAQASKFHQEIGQEIAKTFNLAIITTADNFKDLVSGAKDKRERLKLIEDPDTVIKFLKSEVKEGDLILIEGRVSPKIVEFLTKK